MPNKLKTESFYNFFEIQNFQKKRKICCKTMPGDIEFKIPGWCIYFWQTYGLKTVFIEKFDEKIQTAILSISRHRTEIKTTLLEYWDQNSSETHIFYSKMSIQKFYLELTLYGPGVDRGWSGSSLSLACMESDCKMVSILNSTRKSDHKSYAACPKKNFWSWWHFVNFHDLTLTLFRP